MIEKVPTVYILASRREKQMKEWQRGWKITAIEKLNPLWRDLYDEQCGAFIA